LGALLVAPCLDLLASPPIASLAGHRWEGPFAVCAAAAGALTTFAALLKNRRGVPEPGEEDRRRGLVSTAGAAGAVYGLAVLLPAFFLFLTTGFYLQVRDVLGGDAPHFSDTLPFALSAVLVLSPPLLPLALILATSLDDEPPQRRVPDSSSRRATLWSATDVTVVTALLATAALLPTGAPIWLGTLTGLTAGYLTHGHLLLTTICERTDLITSGVLPPRPRAFLDRSVDRGLILRVDTYYHIASRLLLDHLTSTKTRD
jgi:hypothetical protein